jgi:adenosine deaminase
MIKGFIETIPKAELLVHIEGTLEPEMLLSLAKKNNITLPYSTVEQIQSAYLFNNLKAFLEVYYSGIKVLVTEQDFYDLTQAYLEKAVAQQIRHVEITFDPQAHIERGVELDTVINGIHRAAVDAEKQSALSVHLIMCFMRELSLKDSQAILQKVLPYKDWIVAIGLDSTEMHDSPNKFSELFAQAREYGFLTVASAGETSPPEYIWQAIDNLKVSRIGFGVRCVEDQDLMSRMAMTRIPISVSPIANVKLGLIKSMRQHPLKKMYDEGLCVTINSDNPAYFRAYLNDNFKSAQEALRFDKNEIYELARNSFLASFLDHNQQEKYLNELEKFLKHKDD